MHKSLGIAIISLMVAATAFVNCQKPTETEEKAKLKIVAKVKSPQQAPRRTYADATSEGVTVEAYNVTFKKIEIGNSEDDKFTLWEGDKNADITNQLEFDNVKEIKEGEYEYCRITIGTKISVSGKATSGSAVDEGTAQTEVAAQHLFSKEEGSLSEALKVEDGKTFAVQFDITNKVKWDYTEKELYLDLPVLSITIQ
jgi:hypothetical protein